MNDQLRAALLDMINDENLEWTARGAAGTTFRYYDNESPGGYRLLTTAERQELKAMLAEGEVKLEPGWRHHKGLVRPAQPSLFG